MAKRRKSQPGPFLLHAELLPERIPDRSEYPFNLPALRGFSKFDFHPKVTFLVGENGAGKSTLLEAFAVAFGLNPEGGSQNFHFNTRASHSHLCDALRLAKTMKHCGDSYFLRAESYFNLASNIEELDREPSLAPKIIDSYGGVSLHEQSHGESFFALFSHRLREHGMYFFDEPEAALSPRRQLEFLVVARHCVDDFSINSRTVQG
ncbi:MAG: AAA family ATPase [Fimbriiglobus sp.]